MSSLLSKVAQLRTRIVDRSYGWTGIEIGRHAIQLAQIEKVRGNFRLSAIWTVEHACKSSPDVSESDDIPPGNFAWETPETFSKHGIDALTLEQLDNLNALFRGRKCSATLNDGLIEYRELELPEASPSESQSMVHSEIAIETACEFDEIVTACWNLPKGNARSSSVSMGAVSLRKSTAMRLANQLLSVGFECQTLDALPCAMARSLSIMNREPSSVSMAIDLGYEQSTLIVMAGEQLVLTRCLRNQGLLQLLHQIAATYDVSLSDANVLLIQSESKLSSDSLGSNNSLSALHQQINRMLQSLRHEIERTLRYLDRSLGITRPAQLVLMGHGSAIPNIARLMEGKLGIATIPWTMEYRNGEDDSTHLAPFAVAAGLSLLAWEDAQCM
jgi:Tfp pilus assembly PilM family ATPase